MAVSSTFTATGVSASLAIRNQGDNADIALSGTYAATV